MNRTIRFLGLAGLVSILSCSKPGVQKISKLVVDLQQSAITIDQIDSADVVFHKTGTDIKVKQRFTKTAQTLTASMQSLTTGTWNGHIELYTKAVNQLSNQYIFIKPVLIEEEVSDVQVAGPGAASGNGWLKRHVKASAGNEVVLIVPEELYDPYFEFRSKVPGPLVFGVQREAININYLVDLKTWACTETCLNGEGRITDTNYFMPFTQTIMSELWTKNEISISVHNNVNAALLIYERTWGQ